MRQRTTLRGIMVALSLMLLVPPGAHAQTSSTRYYACLTRDFSKRVGYVSPIFAVDAKQADFVTIGKAWGAMITAKYGDAALPYYPCSQGGYATPAQAKDARDRFIASVRDQMKQPIVEVAWTYDSAPAVTVAAEPAPKAAPPAPPKPAAPATLTAADRQAAQAEVTYSKGYCQYNMHELRTLLDCDCFAQMVLHHRLAHPEERVKDVDGSRPVPVSNLIGGFGGRLDCTECLTDQRIAAYVSEMMHETNGPALQLKAITQAKLDAMIACTTKGFTESIRAKPYVDEVQRQYNLAAVTCAGSKP